MLLGALTTFWHPKQPKSDASLFTRIAESSEDEAHLVVYRGKSTYVLLNRYPYSGGHLMVVTFTDKSLRWTPWRRRSRSELMETTNRTINILKEVMAPQGFNVGMNLGSVAGAGIEEHLHMHIVPRWGRHQFHAGDRFHSCLTPVLSNPGCTNQRGF